MRSRFQIQSIQPILNNPNAWLLAIGLGLIALHLQLFWRITGSFDQISLELIGWSALFFCLWQRRHTLVFRSDPVSRFFGWSLLGLVLIRSFNLQVASEVVLGATPLLIGVAIALLAVGIKQFKHYSRELWILLAIAIPSGSLAPLIERSLNVSLLTAKYAHLLMWYGGFSVQRNGVQLILPTGAVEVFPPCSGLDAALISLKVAVFFLLVFPTTWKEKLLVPAIAIASAFTVNGFRIMLMAHLVASKNTEAFNYWHTGTGAQVFAMIAMTIFTQYCQWLIERRQSTNVSDQSETSITENELEKSQF